MTLPEIEYKLLNLLNRFDLRRVLRRAVQIGTLLQEAKDRLPEQDWPNWVARLGITRRTEQLYRQGANICAEHPEYLDHFTSLNGLLRFFRQAKWAARQEARREARQEAIRKAGPADERFRVFHADCRRYAWPRVVDVIATDPPWHDLAAYRWLARFALRHLRPGGLAVIQAGIRQHPQVAVLLQAEGLQYVHTLAIVYRWAVLPRATAAFASSWRPIYLVSKGPWDHTGLSTVTDALTITLTPQTQAVHDWQQPIEPWRHWLQALTRPGELIVDPYAGAGSIGCAVKLVGGRRYLGSEIDSEHAKVAQGRINAMKEEH